MKAEPPYQTVVYFPSSAALDLDHSRNPGMFLIDFVIRSGRALMYPIYTGTYERQIPMRGYNDQRDVIIRASKDLQRSIDYLEIRDDIDIDRLAFCGLSLGASWGPIFTAIEDRFVASVLIAGGLGKPAPGRPPETVSINFAPRSTVPVLMVNGRNDFWTPLETEIRPMFELQGASSEDKELVLLDGGHVPDSPKDALRPVLDFLDRTLGPVGQ
jgi:dienelactone hydrolase